MGTGTIVTIVIVVVILGLIMYVIGIYNTLVTLKNRYRKLWIIIRYAVPGLLI